MRRPEKEITDREEIDEIINKSTVCRLALCDSTIPYVVPVCFGYENNTLYFHSSTSGMKIDMLEKNNSVCFEMDIDTKLVIAENSCNWGMKYRSVIGFGRALLVNDPDEKRKGLDAIMKHYGGPEGNYSDKMIDKMLVIKVKINSVTGKKSNRQEMKEQIHDPSR